jgi:tRNA pseudouridine38-40 synthase
MRYFLEFSYLGTAYHGWQSQPNAISVQETLEGCMSLLLGKKLEVVAAGRTDTGVHAQEMYAHFDYSEELPKHFVARLNAFLPRDISVKQVHVVHPNAHARFDAISRTYRYLIVQDKNPFWIDSAHWVQTPLDFEAMNRAASYLLEFKDFKAFSRSNTDVKTYNCNIQKAVWTQESDCWVFTITADRFLRNMVRAVVGTLLLVGKGKLPPEAVKDIIKSRNRSQAGASVPAKGLYLNEIIYSQSVFTHG